MRTMIIFGVSLLLASVMSSAQADSTPPKPPNTSLAAKLDQQDFFGVGLQIGLATGSGVSVQYSMSNRFALEINGGYLAVQDPVWSVGFEAQFLLNNTSRSRFYALAGMSVNSVSAADTNKLDAPTRIGIGVGYGYFVSKHLCLAVELPLTIFLETDPLVLPLPQFQMLYYFK